MSKLAEYLNRHILGNVFDRLSIREAYSTDRSILKVTPRLVAVPDKEGSKAFRRYRDIDEEMKKDLVKLLD